MTGLELGKLRAGLRAGPYPTDDGWRWLYRLFGHLNAGLQRAICGYLWPRRCELARQGRLYRALGVHHFGRVVPTGGVGVRRLTRSRMRPYTLAATSVRAARQFFYRTCVFEILHLPFFLALVVLSAQRLWAGRADLAMENMLVNVAVNLYPMMHHRRTRGRIVRLLLGARRHAPP